MFQSPKLQGETVDLGMPWKFVDEFEGFHYYPKK